MTMGAWGTGVFEDDAARDWLAGLIESADPSAELAAAVGGDLGDASGGVRLLAAAEVLAALGGQGSGLPARAERWLETAPDASAELARAALAALDRVADPTRSALAASWVRASFAAPDDRWLAGLDDLAARLARSVGEAPRAVPRVEWEGTVEAPEELAARLGLLRELLAEEPTVEDALRALAELDPVVARALEEGRRGVMERWVARALRR